MGNQIDAHDAVLNSFATSAPVTDVSDAYSPSARRHQKVARRWQLVIGLLFAKMLKQGRLTLEFRPEHERPFAAVAVDLELTVGRLVRSHFPLPDLQRTADRREEYLSVVGTYYSFIIIWSR
ncbi:MAG: hypothetical protein DMF63_02495 [Acidobacteria bacterium]|nr:MAG: hypothetical protein DMF63_02495 [Acidobacteriota bacterium]